MPRNLAAALQDFPTITRPVYLVEVEFSSTDILRFNNTSDVLTANGKDYYPWEFTINGVDSKSVGRTEASLNFSNLDLALGVEFMARSSANRKGRVYLDYEHWRGVRNPYLLIDGWLDGCEIGDRVQFNIVSTTLHRGGAPRLTFGKPLFNHLPGSGFWFRWNGQDYRIDRR